ncbi:MAG: 30S ribosomal protein S6 [Anaerolineales bacterium]|nr:30S ribosomal protein S6 [Anaerolineales bacterium]MCW5856261.1 30S ribosomal protein S6 [Anaerolineales bacterium]
MRNYEVIYIVHPDLDSDAFTQLNKQVEGWIKDGKGKIEKSDIWGKRKLAYQIKKQSEGQYVLLRTEMDPSLCATLEQQFRLQESVLRFIIVALEEEAEPAG